MIILLGFGLLLVLLIAAPALIAGACTERIAKRMLETKKPPG